MSEKTDDLDAVRKVAEAIKQFEPADQERILRWAKEKVGLVTSILPAKNNEVQNLRELENTAQPLRKHIDIKSFISQKKPTTDSEFATAVAYYYRFEAQESDRKDTISSEDLRDAYRLCSRKIPPRTIDTLNNTMRAGFLDKADRGAYKINTVGENLITMTLGSKKTAGNIRSSLIARKSTKSKKLMNKKTNPRTKPKKS